MFRTQDIENNHKQFFNAINFHIKNLRKAVFPTPTHYDNLPKRFVSGDGAKLNSPDLHEVWHKFYSHCLTNKNHVYTGTYNEKTIKDEFKEILDELSSLSLRVADRILKEVNFNPENKVTLNNEESSALLIICNRMQSRNIDIKDEISRLSEQSKQGYTPK